MVRKIFILLIFIVSVPWSALASTSVLRYEGELSGGALSTSTLTNQQFEATIRRPDSCGGDLISPSWTSSIVTITNGKFVISPSFNSATLAQVMNPNNNFGAGCISNPARNLVIRWNSGAWETFNVSITDSPRAALASEAMNASAIGGKPVQAALTCNANEFLKYDGAKFVCVPIAAIDIPVMDATKITSGTFSAGLIPSLTGDVTGTIGANSVTKLVGRALDTAIPANGQVLTWNNLTLKWEAQTPASYTLPNIVTGATTVNTGTSIPVITYDNQGRITNASSVVVNDSTKLALSGGTLSGSLNMGNQAITQASSVSATTVGVRSLNLHDTGANKVTLSAPTTTANYSLTLPNAQGANGQVLTNNGLGVLSWSSVSSAGEIESGATAGLTANGFKAAMTLTREHSGNAGAGIYGSILKPDLTPVNSSTTQFRIQIRTPGTENCVLWEEQLTKDLSTSNGRFSLRVNDSTEPTLIANTLPYSWERVFFNSINYTALTGCSVGTTYSPSPGDGRVAQLFFRQNAVDLWEQLPAMKINLTAIDSIALNGLSKNSFLQIDPASAYVPLPATSVTTLVDLANNYNTQLADVTTCLGSQKPSWNSVMNKWQCVNISGFVTSVGILMPTDFTVGASPVTTSGNLNVTWTSQGQNKILASPDGAAGAPAFRTLVSNDLPIIPILKGGTGATTVSAARSALGLGNSAILNTGSVASTVAAGDDSRFPAAICNSGNKSRWTGTTWVCETDALGAEPWFTSGADIFYATGEVGIGISNPTTLLHLNASIPEVAMTLQNTAAGGRSYAVSSTSAASTVGGGRFLISDQTVGVARMVINDQGYVGVASVNPRSHLDVSGTILPASSVGNGTATVNFLNGNLQHTALSCQPFALHNLKSGGTYTFIVKGAIAGTCTFTAFSDAGVTALTLHVPGSMVSNASTHTIFNFLVSDTDIYVTYANGL